MALQNASIDQLPQNGQIPSVAYVAIKNMDNTITERLELSKILPVITSQNFEWISNNEYDEDEVVTYSGKWYQSEIDNNEGNVPGVDVTKWVEVNVNNSGGIQFWEPAIYIADEVIVMKAIGDETTGEQIYFFRLSPTESRPFTSEDFEDELQLQQWEHINQIDIKIAEVGVTDITIDMWNLKELMFRASTGIMGDLTIVIINANHALRIPSFKFTIAISGSLLIFPANTKMSDPRWDNTTKAWLGDEGDYDADFTLNPATGIWYVKIHGPFI